MKYLIKINLVSLVLVGLLACKKFVDVPPPATQLIGPSVYNTNTTAAAAITGIYQTMVNLGHPIGGGTNGLSALLGLSADEFSLYPNLDATLNETYTNSLSSKTNIRFWDRLYYSIYQANAALEGLSSSSNVTISLKQQLVGEAKFIRAFCHFYLVNIYGEVPIVTTTNYKTNQLIVRSQIAAVYDQIIGDLKEAQSLLSDNYLSPSGTVVAQRVRPNKGVATALLARVYLYQQKWASAEDQATAIINNNNYQLSPDLSKVFLSINNKEAIWQLESPNTGFNAPDGALVRGYFNTNGPNSSSPFLLNDTILNKFETGDLRKTNWTISRTIGPVSYHFPYKYKLANNTGQPPVEFPVLLRLAELYLIRAEARAQLSNNAGAKDDLNKIRSRANLGNTVALTQEEILNAIQRERQLELFTEYGHRWFDLRRTGNLDAVMSLFAPLKGGIWQSSDQLYPLPLTELQANPSLTQNPGY